MMPGRKGRDDTADVTAVQVRLVPAMMPGRKGRDDLRLVAVAADNAKPAMMPGRKGRDDARYPSPSSWLSPTRNDARPQRPG